MTLRSINLLLFSFHGCVTRAQWLAVHTGWCALALFICLIDVETPTRVGPLCTVFFLTSLWPLLAVNIKRWHDRGKSGAWCLINFIPIIGTLWAVIELGFLDTCRNSTRAFYRDFAV